MEIIIKSPDELHIVTFNHFSERFITFNDERFELVHLTCERTNRKRTYIFCKNYF